jgi:Protein of unknown function (DUF3788)
MTKTAANLESTTFRNAFIGQAKKPTDRELAAALGATNALWDQLVAELSGERKLTREWNSYSIKAGWSLRLKQEARNIVYLSPSQSGFMASFALSDKAMQAARACRFPKYVLKIIAGAKKYAEGRALRIAVGGSEDIAVVKKLAKIELEN